MISRKQLSAGMLLLLLLASLVLTGCSTTVKLYPIERADIFSIEQGSTVTHKDGESILVEKDGFFLSDMYLEEVSRARVEKK